MAKEDLRICFSITPSGDRDSASLCGELRCKPQCPEAYLRVPCALRAWRKCGA